MICRIERRVQTAKCTSCQRLIPRFTAYFRTQYRESRYVAEYGRNICKRCMVHFVVQLLFPFLFNIFTRGRRNIKEAKRQLTSPYCPADEGGD